MPTIITALSSQDALTIAQEKAVSAVAATLSGLMMPQAMNATISAAVTLKTKRSTPKLLRWSSTLMPGTSPGWMSCG